jgi:hypothetical protein
MHDHHRNPGARPHTSSLRRRGRRAVSRVLGTLGLVGVLLGTVAVPAQAHVPIVLLVLSPEDRQTVGSDPEVVIYAQRTLGGVEQVAYTLTLDQRPIDPATGRLAAGSGQIRAGQRVRVSLHDLSAGAHQLKVSYRPDQDEPVMTTTAAFTVRSAPAGNWPVVPIAIGVGLAALAGAAVAWWARRRRVLRVTH